MRTVVDLQKFVKLMAKRIRKFVKCCEDRLNQIVSFVIPNSNCLLFCLLTILIANLLLVVDKINNETNFYNDILD